MGEASLQSEQLHGWLERIQAGDPSDKDELIRHVCDRLLRLTRKMLRDYPGVRRWEQTDDVVQNAMLRLLRALEDVKPASARDFFALAALQIRRELLDLARHYYGPEGPAAHHASVAGSSGSGLPAYEKADRSTEPGDLQEWCDLHEGMGQLPDEEREIVDLLFYQGLTQAAAARLLGVTVRTVQRRWQSALRRLHRALKG